MTITMTDVLSTLPDNSVRYLLERSVQDVQEREAREQSRRAAQEEAQRAAVRTITGICASKLPVSIQNFVTDGFADGWVPPAHGEAHFIVEIAVPGLTPQLRARFKYVNGSRSHEWKLEHYLLPGITRSVITHSPQFAWAENNRARTDSLDTALANLVQLEAEYRTALESAQKASA